MQRKALTNSIPRYVSTDNIFTDLVLAMGVLRDSLITVVLDVHAANLRSSGKSALHSERSESVPDVSFPAKKL